MSIKPFISCSWVEPGLLKNNLESLCPPRESEGTPNFKKALMFSKHIQLLFILIILTTSISPAQNYRLSSNNKKALKFYNSAATKYKSGNYFETIEYLTKSLKHDANFIEAWLLLGDSYTEADSVLKAISSYKSAISIDSSFFPQVYYFLGNLNYKAGQYQKSVFYYRQLSKYPGVSEELLLIAYEKMLISGIADNLVKNPVPVAIRWH